jgi:type I restriction-modification system DNA methylase subunit
VSRNIALRIVEGLVFLKLARECGLEPAESTSQRLGASGGLDRLRKSFSCAAKRYHSTVFELRAFSAMPRFESALRNVSRKIQAMRRGTLTPETLGRIYATDVDGDRKGVHVTPEFISDYLVRRTLAPLLSGSKRPVVLDPACGAGAFPLKVFDLLAAAYGARTSFKKKRRLLTTCIHGVDIDAFGVELTKLSLLLKMHAGTIVDRRAAVPDLSKNIRCADSLMSNIAGRFDAVIVNPPFISLRDMTRRNLKLKRRLMRKYSCAREGCDAYVLFLEKSFRLLRAGGRLGIILPNTWAIADWAEACRALLLTKTRIENIVDLTQMCDFSKTNVYPHILISEKTCAPNGHHIKVVKASSRADLKPGAAVASLLQFQLCERSKRLGDWS